MDRGDDLVSRVGSEHEGIRRLARRVERTTDDLGARQRIVADLAERVTVHRIATTEVVTPAARAVTGDAIVVDALAPLAAASDVAHRIAEMEVIHPAYEPLVRRLLMHVRRHMDQEERRLFPPLRWALAPERTVLLGNSFLASSATGAAVQG